MSDIVVTLASGASKRLLTAGKYCDRNIVVVAESGEVSEIIRDYDLIVRFFDAYGEATSYSGYYQFNDGAKHEFNSLEAITLLDYVDSDSVVRILLFSASSLMCDNSNCDVAQGSGLEVVDGIETTVATFTISGFTGDSTVSIRET